MPVTVIAFLVTSKLPTLTGLAIRATTRPAGCPENRTPTLASAVGLRALAVLDAWTGPATSQLRIMTRNVLNSFMFM